MTITVYVDNREHKLFPLIQDVLSAIDGVSVIQQVLEIGDIMISKEDKDVLLFERKTISDLASSVKDGRYKEQKHRMISKFPPHRISYIIEGGSIIVKGNENGLSKSVFNGVYANTMYRDGIHMIFVKNIQETASWICDIAQKLISKPDSFDEEIGGADNYVSACRAKSKKMDNIDPRTCYHMQLAQIPGISHKLAENIAELYPNFTTLFQAITPLTKEAAIQLFSKIPLIGKKKASIIIDYLQPQ